MGEARTADLPDHFFELKLLFLHELAEGLPAAQQAFERLKLGDFEEATLHVLRDYFHRIAGMAATCELSLLGRLAAVCEEALIDRAPSARSLPSAFFSPPAARGHPRLDRPGDLRRGTGGDDAPDLPDSGGERWR